MRLLYEFSVAVGTLYFSLLCCHLLENLVLDNPIEKVRWAVHCQKPAGTVFSILDFHSVAIKSSTNLPKLSSESVAHQLSHTKTRSY